MLDAAIRNETQETLITEYHDEGYVVLCDELMAMHEAIALVERIPRRDKTRFVIFQPDRTVGLYR